MSSIQTDLQLAQRAGNLVNLYQINSDVVYTGYIAGLAPDGVLIKTFDDGGLQDGAVLMRYTAISAVETDSEDLDKMAYRIQYARQQHLNSLPNTDFDFADHEALMPQIIAQSMQEHQMILLVNTQGDYLEGHVSELADTRITFQLFDKFNYQNNQTMTMPLTDIQILEFLGKELLLESAYTQTLLHHLPPKLVRRPSEIQTTLSQAIDLHQLVAIQTMDADGMFFVGYVNTINADSVAVNLIDMTGQFGGYTICQLALIDTVTVQADYLNMMRAFIELNRQFEFNSDQLLNAERLFDPTVNLFSGVIQQAAQFGSVLHITLNDPDFTDITGYPTQMVNGHFVFHAIDDDQTINQIGTLINVKDVLQLSFEYLDAHLTEQQLKEQGKI